MDPYHIKLNNAIQVVDPQICNQLELATAHIHTMTLLDDVDIQTPSGSVFPHRTTTPRRRRGPLTLTSPSVHDLRDTKKACQTLSIALFRQRRRSQYRCTSHTVAGGRPDGRGRPAPELRLVSHLQSPPLLHSFLSQPYPVSVPVRVAIRTPCPGPLLRSGGNADIMTANWCSRRGTTNL